MLLLGPTTLGSRGLLLALAGAGFFWTGFLLMLLLLLVPALEGAARFLPFLAVAFFFAGFLVLLLLKMLLLKMLLLKMTCCYSK